MDPSEFFASEVSGNERAHAEPSTPAIREFLAFKIGDGEFGIDILKVQEIRSFERPTRMAHAAPHVLGMVNLRGVIVPIVDMRIKFGQAQVVYDHLTVVIVLNIGAQVVGMVVDGVSDVLALTPEQMRPAPAVTSSAVSDHLLGIGSLGERMLMLLDIEQLMTSPDMELAAPALQ